MYTIVLYKVSEISDSPPVEQKVFRRTLNLNQGEY